MTGQRIFIILWLVLCLNSQLNVDAQEPYWSPHWRAREGIVNVVCGNTGPDKIMLLGDSILESYFWNDLSGVQIVNAGMGGIGLNDLLPIAERLVSTCRPRVVVVMVGTNDLLGNRITSLDEYIKVYQRLLEVIHAHKAICVVCGVLPMQQGKGLVQNFDVRKWQDLNERLKEVSIQKGSEFIDVSTFATPPEMFMRDDYSIDGVHPYGVGMDKLRELLEPAIVRALSRD